MIPYAPVYNPGQNRDYQLRASNPAANQQLVLQRQMQAAWKYQEQMIKQQQHLQKNQKGDASAQDVPGAGQEFGNGYTRQGQLAQGFRKGMTPGRFRPHPKATTHKRATVKKAAPKAAETEEGKAENAKIEATRAI